MFSRVTLVVVLFAAVLLQTHAVDVALLRPEAPVREGGREGGAVPGVMVAITQNFLNYCKDLLLPLGIQAMLHLQLPDPLVKGEKDSIEYSVTNAKIHSLTADAALTLSAPANVMLTVTNLAVDVTADVHGRETIWPHPSVTAHADASTSTASASATLAVSVVGGKPVVSVAGCTVNVDLSIHISGLGLLDKIGDLIANEFKGAIDSAIKKQVCTLIEDTFVTGFLDPFLKQYNYQQAIPLPAPINATIVLDYHLASAHVVKTIDGSSTYLEVRTTGEAFTPDNRHYPNPATPLPGVTTAQLGGHMATAQVGEWSINTVLWATWVQGVLQRTFPRSALPLDLGALLTTDSYKLLIPELYLKHPHTNLTLLINASSVPAVTLTPLGLSLTTNATFTFLLPDASLAFDMWCPFASTVKLSTRGNNITGSLSEVNVVLHSGLSPYGHLGPEMVGFLSGLLDKVVNAVVLPIINDLLKPGIPLPSLHAIIPGVGTLSAAFVDPELSLAQGYVLTGTNAQISITP